MLRQLLLVAAFSVAIDGQPNPDPKYPCTYFIDYARTIRPGLNLTVRVHILSAPAPVNVNFVLVNGSSKEAIVKYPQETFQPGVPRSVQLTIPADLRDESFNGFFLNITGSGGLRFNSSDLLNFNTKAFSVFIQTDKPIYKPGDTVLFRTVIINPSLRVLVLPQNIVITDPKGNRIAQWLNVSNPSGVFEGRLVISQEPIEGSWTITVTVRGVATSQSFEIKKYVLPLFEATMNLPSYGDPNATLLCGNVSVKYTFGKPVEGSADITLEVPWRRSADGPKLTQKVQLVNGVGKFCFVVQDIRRIYANVTNIAISEVSLDYVSFVISAIAIEAITGKEVKAEAQVTFYLNPYRIEFVGNSGVFKPGMTFLTLVKITKVDGSKVDVKVNLRVNVTLQFTVIVTSPVHPPPLGYPDPPVIGYDSACTEPGSDGRRNFSEFLQNPYTWPRYYTIDLTFKPEDFTEEGLIPLSIDIPDNVSSFSATAEALGAQAYLYADRAFSPSDNYIQIDPPANSEKPRVGETVTINVRGTEKISDLSYQVISKGQVVLANTVTFAIPSRSVSFPLTITSAMVPTSRLLVYRFQPDGEVLADSIYITIDGLFDNPITLTFSKNPVKPGESVALLIKTAVPNTLVNVLSVDKSVTLMATGNDITAEKVRNELYSYENDFCWFCPFASVRWWWPIYRGTDAASVFSGAGVIFVTNCLVYDRNSDRDNQILAKGSGGLRGLASNSLAISSDGQLSEQGVPAPPGLQGPERVRTDFAERWLFDSVVTNNVGEASITRVAPDTITSFVTTAFGVHPDRGLSVTENATELVVFQPLFVRVELPASVIRGEILCFRATAFNYYNTSLSITIALSRSRDYDNIRIVSTANGVVEEPFSDAVSRDLGNVAPDTARSTFFCIRPRSLGRILLNVTLFSTIPGDGVSVTLLVEAEGVPRSESTAVLIDLRNTRNQQARVNITTPPNAVNGSSRVVIRSSGDVMGPAVNNLNNLVQVPAGGGEQNIATFATNTIIYLYLQNTNRLDADTENRIKDYLIQGYQRQLQYQMADGSFSDYGEGTGAIGSTWLTALTVKSLVQAASIIDVDKRIIERALQIFIDNVHQAANGSYIELGNIFNRGLQRGPTRWVALTAYVLTALKEIEPYIQANLDANLINQVRNASRRAQLFLEGLVSRLTDVYELAIVTNALALTNSSQTAAARRRLESSATTDGTTRYYEPRDTKPDLLFPWYNPTSALTIEATAYALCDAARQPSLQNGLDLFRWLVRERNPTGGWISTQDTVVALQCFARYAQRIYSAVLDITIRATLGAAVNSFRLTSENALLLQEVFLNNAVAPGTTQTVQIQANGTGLAVVDVEHRYNVLQEAVDSSYNLTVKVQNETVTYFVLDVCAYYRLGGDSGMAVIQVGIPSGFAPDLAAADFSDSVRQDVRDQKLYVYFRTISSKGTCVRVPMSLNTVVARGQFNYVTVYSYYETRDATTRLYRRRQAGVCDVCPDCLPECPPWKR